jgi:hypothetical protein
MPGGVHDSSRTRVAPVFDRLRARTDDWVRRLLQILETRATPAPDLAGLDLRFVDGYWQPREKGLTPPVSLLSWLIRNPTPELIDQVAIPERSRLAAGDPETVLLALQALRSSSAPRGWHILEGQTYPDVFIETPDALVVVEGKRTESAPTVDTTWLAGRHQIWRHVDAAWEIRGRRRVFGFFVVEARGSGDEVTAVWHQACRDALGVAALESSFPHRSASERAAIAACLLGVTTWQRLCHAFDIPLSTLPDTVGTT